MKESREQHQGLQESRRERVLEPDAVGQMLALKRLGRGTKRIAQELQRQQGVLVSAPDTSSKGAGIVAALKKVMNHLQVMADALGRRVQFKPA